MGVGRTFQAPTLFASMSVLDNVKVGAHARGRNGPLTDALTLPGSRSEEREFDETARRMLAFVGLEAHAAQPAANLSLGAKKRVELARALAARPSCFCSTSRRADSIMRKSPTSARSFAPSATGSASPCCWSSITWGS